MRFLIHWCLDRFNSPPSTWTKVKNTMKQIDTTIFPNDLGSLGCFNEDHYFFRQKRYSAMFSFRLQLAARFILREPDSDWPSEHRRLLCFFVGFVFYPWLLFVVRSSLLTDSLAKNRALTNTLSSFGYTAHRAQWDLDQMWSNRKASKSVKIALYNL